MRKTTSKGRKTNSESDEESTTNSGSLEMEMELLAVKAKNSELTKAHARLVHENCEMKNEILLLRRELVDFQAKTYNLESQLKKLGQEMNRCTPSLVDILNLFLDVPNSINPKPSILNASHRFSDRSFTPKPKAITHTVKPHTVNGTVLNLNPTISLTRLNPVNNERQTEEPSSSTIDYRNPLPSTSNSDDHAVGDVENDNLSPQLEGFDITVDEFVMRKSQLNCKTSTPFTTNSDDPLDVEDEVELEEGTDDSQDGPSIRRLTPIHEESICSTSANTRTSLGEIRIYLSRLTDEEMQVRKSMNESCTSTEANANDTRLNIETTVIENQETLASKTLRADIMVFSPHSNSTRADNDSLVLDNLSLRDSRKSAIQSAEVTPSSGFLNEDKEQNANSSIPWILTPSMSAMGDIDKSNYSRLEILTSERKLSPMVPAASPPRKSKARRRVWSVLPKEEEVSPRSSRGGHSGKKSVSSFISRQRGGSDEKTLTPIVVLDKLDSTVMEHRHTRSSPIIPEVDHLKENENMRDNTDKRSTKSKKKIRSNSPKRSAKRKKTDHEDTEKTDHQSTRKTVREPSLHEKIREIQIRLSNYVPESSVEKEASPKNCSKRPARAARPTSLKDVSLKVKLRRT